MSTIADKIPSPSSSNGDNSSATSSKNSEKLASTSVTRVFNPDSKTAIHKILSELECSICLELYLSPQSLACGHVFCEPCLSGWLTSQTQQKRKCPECRKTAFVLPSDPYAGTLIPAYKLGAITTVVENFLPKHASEAREERKKEWASIREALQESKIKPSKTTFNPPAVNLPRSAGPSLTGVTAPQTARSHRATGAPAASLVFDIAGSSTSARSAATTAATSTSISAPSSDAIRPSPLAPGFFSSLNSPVTSTTLSNVLAESSTRGIRPLSNPAHRVPVASSYTASMGLNAVSGSATSVTAANTAVRLITIPPGASSITSTVSVSASPAITAPAVNMTRTGFFAHGPMPTTSISDSQTNAVRFFSRTSVPTVSTTPATAASTNNPFGSSAAPTNANGGFSFTQAPFPNIFAPQQDHDPTQPNTFVAPGNEPANTPAWWRNPARVWSFDPNRGLWV